MDKQQILARVGDVAIASPATRQLLVAATNPDVSLAAIADIIANDTMLATKVLKMANSAYYGLSGRVGNVTRAVGTIGLVQLRSLAVMSDACLRRTEPYRNFTAMTLFYACGAAELAGSYGLRTGDAFSMGLLCEIGQAFQAKIDPSAAAQARAQQDPIAFERAAFGADHQEIARVVLDEWNFPASMTAAIANHHTSASDANPGAKVLAICHHLWAENSAQLADFGINSERAERLVGKIAADVQGLEAALGS